MIKKNTIQKEEPEKVDVMGKLLEKIEALEKKSVEDDKKLKLLYEVADKGRVFNYEAKENSKVSKKAMKVKLSVFNGGIITSWRVMKDQLIKHPTTGMTVGEEQEYEIIVLDPDNNLSKVTINGYPRFSDARYNERIEANIVGKSEGFDGKVTYDVELPDGRSIKLEDRFLN